MSENMTLDFESLFEGKQLIALTKPPISKVQLVKYAGASGDFNPLHTDDEFAKSLGMDGVIAHGMLVMGFLGQYLMELTGNIAEIEQFSMRFGAMTKPEDQIICSAVVKKVYECEQKKLVDIELKAEKGPNKVVGSGKATIRFR